MAKLMERFSNHLPAGSKAGKPGRKDRREEIDLVHAARVEALLTSLEALSTSLEDLLVSRDAGKCRMNTRVLLVAYKDGREAVKMNITNTPTAELAKILWAQEILGRTWEYHFI